MKSKDITIIYVSSVDLNESSGQGSFEKNFISHLTETKSRVYFFTVNESIPGVEDEFVFTATLGKKRVLDYFSQQIEMFRLLRKQLPKITGEKVIFVRESALVAAPLLFSKLHDIPLVIRSGPGHVNLVHYGKTSNPVLLSLYKIYNGIVQRSASKIIVVTQGIKRTLKREYSVLENKVIVIPNPVNDELFGRNTDSASESLPGLRPSDFTVGYVGAVYFHQRVQDLVGAVRHLQLNRRLPEDLKVLIVGGGDYLDKLRSLILEYDLQRTIFCTGQFQQHEAAGYFSKCDCCVATYSKDFDQVKGSSALKIAEYLYFNKFIIAADIEDYKYLADLGYGKLYRIEDVEDLADKIMEAYNSKENLKIDSRSYVLKKRTSSVIFNRYLKEIYDVAK